MGESTPLTQYSDMAHFPLCHERQNGSQVAKGTVLLGLFEIARRSNTNRAIALAFNLHAQVAMISDNSV